MATTSDFSTPTGVTLTDPKLFRQACYIDGAWVNARSERDDRRRQPGDRRGRRHRAEAGRRRDARGDRGGRPGAAGVAQEDRRRSAPAVLRKWFDLMMPAPGRPGAADDHRAGQAAGRVEGRGRLRRGVHRVVRRGSQARLRRHHSRAPGRQAHRRHQAADRRGRLHHAVELPARDDHAQGRPGARRRLHRGAQARVADAVLGAGAGELAERAGIPKGVFNVVTGSAGGDRRRADLQPDRAEALVHRLDRGRQAADGAVRRAR